VWSFSELQKNMKSSVFRGTLAMLAVVACSAYNGGSAVSWADNNCASGSSECAEFGILVSAASLALPYCELLNLHCTFAVSDSIRQGGSSGCWSTWAPTLVQCLKNGGWRQTSLPGPAGSVVVYSDSQGPYHVALSRGDGTCDQHNHNDCKVTCGWASNYVLAPPGAKYRLILAWE